MMDMIYTPFRNLMISRLALGTVQFGMDYGFTKVKTQAEVNEILDSCLRNGVNFIDTARDYGNSEVKIGHYFKDHEKGSFIVATKLGKIDPTVMHDDKKVYDLAVKSLETSLQNLGMERVELLQSHQPDDSVLLNESFWNAMQRLKKEGLFGFFGISVYDVEPTEKIINLFGDFIDFIQVPYNLLDRRFESLFPLFEKKGIAVVGRSTFLRGFLTADEHKIPAQLHEMQGLKDKLSVLAHEQNISLDELALLFSLKSPMMSTLVGVNFSSELAANVETLKKLKAFEDVTGSLNGLEIKDTALIDPRKWTNASVLAILQARISSTRLPGKALKPLLGKPMLLRQIERIKRAKFIDRLVVATSTDATDDGIEQFCKENNIECFRGDLNDVLDRFWQTAVIANPSHIVRLTGDCPLSDPAVIDQIISLCLSGGYDYVSNTVERTFPDGLDVEIFSKQALETTWKEAKDYYEREHVTPFIYRHPERFKIAQLKDAEDHSALRLTVDEVSDYELVNKIYEAIYFKNPEFALKDVLAYLHEGVSSAKGRKV